MVRILHAADLHLDSAFRALPEALARQRRQESRELVRRLVDTANDRCVQLLLLAGDLFDSDEIYSQTGEELARALERFDGQVVIAPGNHDYYGPRSAYARLRWPENVHIFTSGQLASFDFPQYHCTVYGAAFTAPAMSEDDRLFRPAPPEEADRVRIMLLHGDVGMKESAYRPIRTEQIAGSGMDYMALGHVHACSGVQMAGAVPYAYAGCLEGRGFDELGEKGFLLGDVSRGEADLRFVPFARRRYQVLPVDVSGGDAAAAIERCLPPDAEGDIYRIVLRGETEEPVQLEHLSDELAGRFYRLELRDETRLRRDIWDGCGEDSLRGLFLQRLRQRYETADEAERQRIEQAVRFGLAAMENRDM